MATSFPLPDRGGKDTDTGLSSVTWSDTARSICSPIDLLTRLRRGSKPIQGSKLSAETVPQHTRKEPAKAILRRSRSQTDGTGIVNLFVGTQCIAEFSRGKMWKGNEVLESIDR